jgi:quercetin dioxygenase-like cupin family protein
MKKLQIAIGIAVLALASPARSMDDQVFVNTGDIKWGAAPPVLPKGAKLAVLYGDPGKPGPYVLRLAAPANYRIPPHWHTQTENLTIVSGALYLGMGDKLVAKEAQALKAGGYHYLPAKQHHYAFTRGATVIQVSGEGPFDINYIDPKDNPAPAAK